MNLKPNLDRNRLRQRSGLAQKYSPRDLARHSHGFWEYRSFSTYAAYEQINSVAYIHRGDCLQIRPWELLYAVSCNFIFTYTFAGNPESFTIKVTLGDESQEITTDTDATYSTVTTNIGDLTEQMYKDLTEVDLYTEVKVSNSADPVDIFGMRVEFCSYKKEDYGDYRSPLYPLFDEKLVIYSKSELATQEERLEEESYLSGLAKR